MQGAYTVGLAKGQGMIPETLLLLREWQPGTNPTQLRDRVLESGVLPRATAYRITDIVRRVFAPRYLRDGGEPARRLKLLLSLGASKEKLTQLFLIHTARANPILHDFIVEVYWLHYAAGTPILERHHALDFLNAASASGKMAEAWSEKVKVKVTRYLLASLSDFKLTRDVARGRREILPYNPLLSTTLYLAHDIHFSGANDNSVLTHPDWALFGLDEQAVLGELKRATNAGYLIAQHSGDLLRITWKYKTMEECLHALVDA